MKTNDLTPAQIVVQCVCARCYGHLVEDFKIADGGRDERFVSCPSCGDAWGGAVIRHSTAVKLGQMAAAELIEVMETLGDMIPRQQRRERKSVEDALKELGF